MAHIDIRVTGFISHFTCYVSVGNQCIQLLLFCLQIGEARALYNLGNVYHTRGKHMGHNTNQDPGQFPPEVKESLQKAVQYYECVNK